MPSRSRFKTFFTEASWIRWASLIIVLLLITYAILGISEVVGCEGGLCAMGYVLIILIAFLLLPYILLVIFGNKKNSKHYRIPAIILFSYLVLFMALGLFRWLILIWFFGAPVVLIVTTVWILVVHHKYK